MSVSPQPVLITPQKQDPAWKHCHMFKEGDRVVLKCHYCGKLTKGGGIRRMKEHLACRKGNGAVCTQVPIEVRLMMQQSLGQAFVRNRKGKNNVQGNAIDSQPHDEIEIGTLATQSNVKDGIPFGEIDTFLNHCGLGNDNHLIRASIVLHDPNSGMIASQEERMSDESEDRRKRGREISSCPVEGSSGFGVKRVSKDQIYMAIGKFLYDIGAPLNAVNSVYFQPMIDSIASGGLGVPAPSSQDLWGHVLKNLVEEENKEIEMFRLIWRRTGCSILVQQWNTETGRKLLNFLVYCPEGTVFLRSVDASDTIHSTDYLHALLGQVVEEVGVSNVVQVIMEGGEQYIGKRLTDTYPTLYLGPCGTHCIELMLEDFTKLGWINERIEQAKFITRFVYNSSVVLNMVRRFTSGNDIIVPGITRTSTNFTTLKQLVDLEQSLHTMVTSQEWLDSPCSKEMGGLTLSDFVNNESFWSSCSLIIHLTTPLLQILRMVNSEKRPAMGYIYAGMYRAKETIKKKLMKREDYMVYWNIIDQRWEQQWDLPLHAAGFYLNPKIFYNIEGDVRSRIQSGMFDCIERLVPDINVQDQIMKEMNLYKNAVGDFGRKLAIRARDSLLPVEWWETYGGGCPNLSRLAIRILSQTCSAFISKQSQIPFDKLHATKNNIARQRLSDLVFVQYNMRLKQMVGKKTKEECLDLLSVENMSIVGDWIKQIDSYMEDYGGSDWTALEVPSVNNGPLGPADEDSEDLGTGFDDHEILIRVKEEVQ